MSRAPAAAVQVVPAHAPPRLAAARALIEDYVRELGIDLSFQGFAAELAALPGDYAPPAGALLLAEDADGAAVGVVGVRRFGAPSARDAELKRMYIVPAWRGRGAGRTLALAAAEAARALGYRRLLLDTLASMTGANALYRSLGFVDIPAYRENPFPDAVYLALELGDGPP